MFKKKKNLKKKSLNCNRTITFYFGAKEGLTHLEVLTHVPCFCEAAIIVHTGNIILSLLFVKCGR